MTERDDHTDITAYNVVTNAAAIQAMEDFRTAIYKAWVDADDEKKRQELHGVAVGGEMFWRIMEDYAKHGKSIIENLDERLVQLRASVD